jgi:crotonobetainyl-CoA:carnitine CoA-transferase CaiB-like acyl-CoA transferase
VYDWPGLVAYESDCPILAPDGLIHDYEYNDDLLRDGTARYLQRRDVAHWLGPLDPADAPAQTWYRVRAAPGGQEIEVFAPLYRKSAGTFRVRNEDCLVRFRQVLQHPDTPDIGLWKLR